MDIPFSLNLTDKEDVFNKRIVTEFLREFNKHVRKNRAKLKKLVSKVVADAVQNSKEVQSILHGTLSAELGFIAPVTITKQIYKAIQKSVVVEFESFKYDGKDIKGGLSVVAIHDDFSDILIDIPNASYKSNGHDIDWLKWLLFEGDNIIIADYEITYNPFKTAHSRSGRAVMERSDRNGWQVPSKFSGTQHDNFITRSITASVEKQIGDIMMGVLS